MDSKLLKVCVVMLAAMGLSACSDDDSSDSKSCDAATYAETCVDASSYKTCVNGKVETKLCATECTVSSVVDPATGATVVKACQAAEAQCTANVCKDATTLTVCNNGVPVDQKCTNGCENNACKAETPKTCGNGALDAGEVCDGDKFADNAKVCPAGTVLVTGKTLDDIACNDQCQVVTTGVCVSESAGALKEGDPCDKTVAEFCDANGNAAYCAFASSTATTGTIAIDECAKGCKVIDLSEWAGQEYTAAACVIDAAEQCTKVGQEIPYCMMYPYGDEEYALSSYYYCAQADDQTYVAVDMLNYGAADFCDESGYDNACSTDKKVCKGATVCDESYVESCKDGAAVYCDIDDGRTTGVVATDECGEETTCGVADGYAYCMESCTTENETVISCLDYSFFGVYASSVVCKNVDGKLLAVPTDIEACEASCKNGKGCVVLSEEDGKACTASACDTKDSDVLLYCYSKTYTALSCEAQLGEGYGCATVGGESSCYKPCTTEGETTKSCVADEYYGDELVTSVCTASDGKLYYVESGESCAHGCDDTKKECIILDEKEGQSCDAKTYEESCNGTDKPYALYCDEDDDGNSVITAYGCSEGNVCLSIPGENYVDCYAEKATDEEKCTEVGDSRPACVDYISGLIYLSGTETCKKMSDNSLRYVFNVENACLECNADGTCAEVWED